MNSSPIFLRPMGRTGGTLFVTMLDAHPQIAMSYEIYEDRLLDESGRPINLAWAIAVLKQTTHLDMQRWVKQIPDKNFKTFVARARRADVEVYELLQELEIFYRQAGNFEDLSGRLDFIEQLMIFRAKKAQKMYWGGKANIDPRILHQRHPTACFFAMVRDGRDVLASQLNVGNFQTNALKCAQEWRQGVLDFREFMQHNNARAMEIRYETLIENPEAVMRNVCRFIGVDYHPQMLNFDRLDMALFRNPHGHLSHKQIARGLNSESIGRWKHDLAPVDAQIFEDYNHDLLALYGYIP